MPLPVAHGLLGSSIVAAFHPNPTANRFRSILIGMFLGISADFDFALVVLFGSRELHRGFSHSIGFAIIVFFTLVFILGQNKLKSATAYGLAFGSHAILDYLTTKEGRSIELFWPFSSDRVKLGWIGLSEGSTELPLAEIIQAVAVELIIFAPLLLVILMFRIHSKSS